MMITLVAAEVAGDSSNAPDWIAAIAAGLALVLSGFALWYSHRGTKAAENAAGSSKVSADAATVSAAAAERVAKAEVDRDHDMYKPPQIGPESFVIERNPRTGKVNLFLVFTPTRSYRISGDSIEENSRGGLSVPLFNPAGVPVKVYVDELPTPGSTSKKTELQLRFWPPADVDKRDLWTCRCGRPLQSHEEPHWEMTVPVVTPGSPTTRVYSA